MLVFVTCFSKPSPEELSVVGGGSNVQHGALPHKHQLVLCFYPSDTENSNPSSKKYMRGVWTTSGTQNGMPHCYERWHVVWHMHDSACEKQHELPTQIHFAHQGGHLAWKWLCSRLDRGKRFVFPFLHHEQTRLWMCMVTPP
jgi:hypothetical protein